jgi:hypothetical protein
MAWKFLNIGKANERIDALEAELAEAKKTPPAPAQSDAQAKRLDDLAASVATIGEQVSILTATVQKLDGSFKVEIARVETSVKEVQKTITAEAIGSRIALEITARQGQPPLNPGAPNGNAGNAELLKQYDSIQDPREKTIWYRKNKVAYDAAFAASNRK